MANKNFNPFSVVSKPLNVLFPGHGGVHTNMGGYLEQVTNNSSKKLTTYFVFMPATALVTGIGGIGKGIV